MAGQGRLCHKTRSARWTRIASRLRFGFIFASLVAVPSWGRAAETPEPPTTAAHEILRVENGTGTIFFAPDSTIEFSATIRSLTQYSSQRMKLEATLYRTNDGKAVSTRREIVPIDSTGCSDSISLNFTAPDQLGVYEIRIGLTKDADNLWKRFRKSEPLVVQVSHPIIVMSQRMENQDDTASKPFRSVSIHLRKSDWIETLIDSESNRPPYDNEFFADCDPRTQHAMRLWAATERLGMLIEKNGLSGVILTGDLDDDVLSFDSGDKSDSSQSDTLRKIFEGHAIRLNFAIREDINVVSLGRGPTEFPPEFASLKQEPEHIIGAVLNSENPASLAIEFSIDGGALSDPVQQMLQTFVATPANQLALVPPVDPSNTTVSVRAGVDDRYGYISILSLAPWDSEVILELTSKRKWNVVGESASDTLRQPEREQSQLRVRLRPGQLLLLKTALETSELSVRPWSASTIGGKELVQQIKRDVTTVVERIGLLSDLEASDSLTNGGFERSGGIGLVGWMHAQHPPGCVRIDSTERAEGNHSVLLTTDATLSTRTWIVSETITPPDSGILAVSVVIRAERKEDSSPHRMRISMEATDNGEPVRYSSEIEVPRNGQWGPRQIVLEADGVESERVDSLRLTIDSLSRGRVWLDDVRIHHWFPTATEREELQSQTFLAVQGLQRGNLAPSARLLQNRWARYLLMLGPSEDSKPTIRNDEPDSHPGVADRIRSWLPRPLRF